MSESVNELISDKAVCTTAPATPGLFMMADPMFMTVQNLRSFLAALTPTAITPTVVTPTGSFCEQDHQQLLIVLIAMIV